MRSKIIKWLGASIAALTVGFTLFVPVVPAQADSEVRPPFEIRFPQETERSSFSNDWRAPRSGGRGHSGTDIMADAKMTEVYSVADGVVVKVNDSPRAGRYLIIEHAGGWESYYLHLNNDNFETDDGDAPRMLTFAPGIEVGALVKGGQLIGWAGDSGNAEGTSPHTHFELHFQDRAVNPYPYLETAFQRDQADYLRKMRVLRSRVDARFKSSERRPEQQPS